jgi:hypothetical protein
LSFKLIEAGNGGRVSQKLGFVGQGKRRAEPIIQ